jgi:uncharacterized membrane protein HdeD (DUF308 family)
MTSHHGGCRQSRADRRRHTSTRARGHTKKERTMNPTSRPASHLLQRISSSAIVTGLLAVILGAVILLWPGPSILVTSGVFGAYLVLSGVALVTLAFSLPVSTSAGRLLNFISGVASVILGILAFRHFGEGYAVLLLAIWIGVGFIIRGVSALVTAIADKLIPGSNDQNLWMTLGLVT